LLHNLVHLKLILKIFEINYFYFLFCLGRHPKPNLCVNNPNGADFIEKSVNLCVYCVHCVVTRGYFV